MYFSGCATGEQQLCPDSAPNCGGRLIPTAAPGTTCVSECRLYHGARWCCTQNDGCPQGGTATEAWGWCAESCDSKIFIFTYLH